MDHHTCQCVSVWLRQLTHRLIQHSKTVVIILDFYNIQKNKLINNKYIRYFIFMDTLPSIPGRKFNHSVQIQFS